VNNDFRQLARSKQLSSISLDYWIQGFAISEQSALRLRERAIIGTRKFLWALISSLVNTSRRISPFLVSLNITWEVHNQSQDFNTRGNTSHITINTSLSSSPGYTQTTMGMPSPEFLHLRNIKISPNHYTNLSLTEAKYVRLIGLTTDQVCGLQQPASWPLRTLGIDIRGDPESGTEKCRSRMRLHLTFWLPTMEKLSWI
jgi:hypothetical protein